MKRERKQKLKSYRKRFLIVHEGLATEREYINHIKGLYDIARKCHIETHSPKHSSISAMVKKIKQVGDGAEADDELWVVLDRDEQTHQITQFAELAAWEQERELNAVALSTPRFEYWLLLHVMESPHAEKTKTDNYVAEFLSGFSKDLRDCKSLFTKEAVQLAILRAERRGVPTCRVPDTIGTGMGLLVRAILTKAEAMP